MNIICSAGKGTLDHEDCLKCALAGNNPCGFDYVVLKSMFDLDHGEARRADIHVTDLTGCLRRAFYDKTQPEADFVHHRLHLWLGSALHETITQEDPYYDREVSLAIDNIVGSADVVYKDGRLLDIKSTKWLYPNKVPYGSHSLQVNMYARALRKMGREVNRLQIQYICTAGATKCRKCNVPVRMYAGELKCPQCLQYVNNAHLGAMLVDVPFMTDEEIEYALKERPRQLQGAIQAGFAPAAEPGYACPTCPYSETCRPQES